jgi:NADH-quinone oxidoreductase subunit L
MSNLVYLVPLIPFLGFLLVGLGRKNLSKSLAGIIGCGTVLASFIISLLIFFEVRHEDFQSPHIVSLFTFIQFGKVTIPFSFQVDQLSTLFLLIITGVGFLIHVYSTAYMHEEREDHYARYFSYLNRFIFFMLMLVLGNNLCDHVDRWEGGLMFILVDWLLVKNDEYNNAAKKPSS